MRSSLNTIPRRVATGVAVLLTGAVLLGSGPPTARFTPAAVNLGTAAGFAVLAGGGVTDTGPSVISGDVGSHPMPTIPDLLGKEATGIVDRAGATSQQAQRDLALALAVTASLHPDGIVSLAEHKSVPPGVYAVADGEQDVVGGLTLDGQDAASPVWIFVVPNDLTTAPGSTIAPVNGAEACNVFWLVGGSAVLASGSTFTGSILATTSVTVGHDVTITGRLLARTASVSLSGDTITVPVCAANPVKEAPQPDTGVLAATSSSRNTVAVRPSALPPYLPIVTLALIAVAAILAEPRHRHRHRHWPTASAGE